MLSLFYKQANRGTEESGDFLTQLARAQRRAEAGLVSRGQTGNHPAGVHVGLSLGLAWVGHRMQLTQRTQTRRSVPAQANGTAWRPEQY